ncbi:uncharacterized protein [Pyrus communis]|uniref:uncharacterized protein n=1 Tax=Pyrus communis TaxID=23211 RepID=UPI0035BFAFBD
MATVSRRLKAHNQIEIRNTVDLNELAVKRMKRDDLDLGRLTKAVLGKEVDVIWLEKEVEWFGYQYRWELRAEKVKFSTVDSYMCFLIASELIDAIDFNVAGVKKKKKKKKGFYVDDSEGGDEKAERSLPLELEASSSDQRTAQAPYSQHSRPPPSVTFCRPPHSTPSSATVQSPPATVNFEGLNTEHPVLSIGDKLKLIGEYQETVGTCLIFKQEDASAAVHEETGPSEANPFAGKCIMDPNQSPGKQVKPVSSLQRILKFRLAPDLDSHDPPEQSRDPVLHTVQSVAE